ncbi:MAG: acetoacetyl-CoA reductase [Alphaproteobacteria bacterium]|nr:acetoacetyl-CoA reductase [Alphaproteobacteria bacterium]
MSKVAVVTGGIRGIGEAISIGLRDAGYKVVANYMSHDDRAKSFSEKTGIAVAKWDVGDFDACQSHIDQITKDIGPVEILINNAGITRDAPLHKMTHQMWDDVLRVNLTSVFSMSRAVINGMRERGFGRIINISSINGQAGQFGQVNYAAAKAGIVGFTKSLALETASKGITVNAIAPGYIDTEMVQAVEQSILSKIIARIPVGRLGHTQEIARAVRFLVSDDAAFITGSTLTINGGQYMA